MTWDILVGILIAAAAGGWAALSSVAKSLKVDFTKITQEQRDSLIVNPTFKGAVVADVAASASVAKATADVAEAAAKLSEARAILDAAVTKANIFASDCVMIAPDGAIVAKPGVTKIDSVTRTPAKRATVGDSVIGVGKGNGNNRFACDTWYIAPFRGVLSGWSFIMSSETAVATIKRQVGETETEVYTVSIPLSEDGSASPRDAAAAIAYASLVESGKEVTYWGQYGKPAPRRREAGESMADYLVMCLDFPPGGGVNVGRLWGIGDRVVAA